jgi:hypothetical protein
MWMTMHLPIHIPRTKKLYKATRTGSTWTVVLPCFSIKPCPFVSGILPEIQTRHFGKYGWLQGLKQIGIVWVWTLAQIVLSIATNIGRWLWRDDDHTFKPILAKLNELAWFLQKNQLTLCCQSYSKKNEDKQQLLNPLFIWYIRVTSDSSVLQPSSVNIPLD